jgi:hypothetical protein
MDHRGRVLSAKKNSINFPFLKKLWQTNPDLKPISTPPVKKREAHQWFLPEAEGETSDRIGISKLLVI